MRVSIVKESNNAGLNNSKLIRGDTENLIIRITGQSLVVTNYGFTFTAKVSEADPDSSAIIQKTSASGGGIAVTLPAPNLLEAVVSLSPTDTSALMHGDELCYDFQMSTVSPVSTRTLEKGKFKIEGDITRTSPSPPAPSPSPAPSPAS
jgi:hypothetical protein